MKKQCKPNDLTAKTELANELLSIKMRNDEDPKVSFEQINALRNKCNNPGKGTFNATEEQLIATTMQKAPLKCMSSLASTEERLDDGFGNNCEEVMLQ